MTVTWHFKIMFPFFRLKLSPSPTKRFNCLLLLPLLTVWESTFHNTLLTCAIMCGVVCSAKYTLMYTMMPPMAFLLPCYRMPFINHRVSANVFDRILCDVDYNYSMPNKDMVATSSSAFSRICLQMAGTFTRNTHRHGQKTLWRSVQVRV